MTRTALIAGQGALPRELAAALSGAGERVTVAEMDGFPCDIPGTAPLRFRIERLAPFLDHLAGEGVTRVVFAGSLRRPRIEPELIDRCRGRNDGANRGGRVVDGNDRRCGAGERCQGAEKRAEPEPPHRDQQAMAHDEREDQRTDERVVGEDSLQHENAGDRGGYEQNFRRKPHPP